MKDAGDYISREAELERLRKIVEVNRLRTDRTWFTPDGVKYLINEIPAADVRPVVTCGECIHGQGEKMDFWNEYKGIECIGGVVHRKDWFCADGEKR